VLSGAVAIVVSTEFADAGAFQLVTTNGRGSSTARCDADLAA
jgi:hypothetical protein